MTPTKPSRVGLVSASQPPRDDAQAPGDPGAEQVSFSDVLDTIVGGRWLIAACGLIAVVLGTAYAMLASPVYRADALLQVEDAKAAKGLLGDLSAIMGESSIAETEIEIVRSRAVVGEAVRELHLDISARPRRFPIIGGAIARRHAGEGVAPARLGLAGYGWGGERIDVETLEVAPSLVGRPLRLLAQEGGRYSLLGPDGSPLLAGELGKEAAGRGVKLLVSELRARPGVAFDVTRIRYDDAVAWLQRELRIAEKGKKTGILQLQLDGPTPERTAGIVDALARAYLKQNIQRRSAEAAKTLEFIEQQLPLHRATLDRAEAEYERHQARTGTVDVSAEAKVAVERLVELEKAASELRVEAAAARSKFTEEHPAIAAIGMRLRKLEQERNILDARLRKLPGAELESARRLRDVKVASELYLSLLNNAQTLRVVKEGTIGNVRLLDGAVVPSRPVAPRKARVILLSLVLGLAAGALAAFVRRALDRGIEDPVEVERISSVPVSASVPHSRVQDDVERRTHGERRHQPLLAAADPKDLAVESLRSLRTSLQFALAESRNQIVAIGGPAPGVGKSFVTANLAHLIGEAGKRVLVIDADLRRGQLHHHFGHDRGTGLSDAIAGELSVFDAIRPTRSPNVSLLTTGRIPSNPAELLGSERFQRLLEDVAARYELVLVDTPPVLAVTDAALVARSAGITMLVMRAGKHPAREILASLRQFGRNGVRVHGIVVNDVRLDRGLGRRSAYHYQYTYS